MYFLLLFYYSVCLIHYIIHVDLPAPTNVRATVLSHCSVEVKWDQLPDATEYTILYTSTASHISSDNRTTKVSSITNYTLTNLEGNTPYIITVQATASDGRKSALSNKVLIRTGKSNITLQKFNSNMLKHELKRFIA